MRSAVIGIVWFLGVQGSLMATPEQQLLQEILYKLNTIWGDVAEMRQSVVHPFWVYDWARYSVHDGKWHWTTTDPQMMDLIQTIAENQGFPINQHPDAPAFRIVNHPGTRIETKTIVEGIVDTRIVDWPGQGFLAHGDWLKQTDGWNVDEQGAKDRVQEHYENVQMQRENKADPERYLPEDLKRESESMTNQFASAKSASETELKRTGDERGILARLNLANATREIATSFGAIKHRPGIWRILRADFMGLRNPELSINFASDEFALIASLVRHALTIGTIALGVYAAYNIMLAAWS